MARWTFHLVLSEHANQSLHFIDLVFVTSSPHFFIRCSGILFVYRKLKLLEYENRSNKMLEDHHSNHFKLQANFQNKDHHRNVDAKARARWVSWIVN